MRTQIKIKQRGLKSQLTRWGGSFLASWYYAASLAIACNPRQLKGELCGEGSDHVVPGPHAASAHNTVLGKQLGSCLSGSPAHFTSLTVDENILTVC